MKQTLVIGLLGLGVIAITGCQPVASPLMGLIYNETKFGYEATQSPNATKEGKACANTIMGLVATGDASITAAKAAGGITEVSHVDHSAKSTLGIVAEFCTIVKGK
ncbi:TRL-like family protein [Nitrospira sp. NS4]|uniref:TRL-like family protein n=1 Tax=Nitrospira sp. NS4 TaxID=3414498 RepID=UPI003C2BC3DC